jgi:hypothetical protein
VVEAFGFQEARTLTVELGGAIDPAVTLGEFTLDERGIGRFAMEDCLDEILSQVATSDDGTVSGKADPGTGNDGDPGSEPPFPGFPPDLPPDFDPILVRVVDAEGTLYLEGPLPAPRNGRCGGIVPPDLPPLPEPTGGFSPLFPPDGTGGYMLRGMAFLDCSGECCTLGISAGWFDDPGTLTAVVYDAEGNAETLGTLEVTEGFGDLVYDSCSDLPFGVSSLDELAGYRLAIEDADGDPVLKGEFPGIFQWGGGDGTDPGPGVPWGGMPWGGMPWGGMGGGLR